MKPSPNISPGVGTSIAVCDPDPTSPGTRRRRTARTSRRIVVGPLIDELNRRLAKPPRRLPPCCAYRIWNGTVYSIRGALVGRRTPGRRPDGIPAEFLPHVFEPFSQGHPQSSQHGLGLGLAIVKHLVDAHHGRIRVESAGSGRGTTFVVEFPLGDALPAAPAAESPATYIAAVSDRTTLH